MKSAVSSAERGDKRGGGDVLSLPTPERFVAVVAAAAAAVDVAADDADDAATPWPDGDCEAASFFAAADAALADVVTDAEA